MLRFNVTLHIVDVLSIQSNGLFLPREPSRKVAGRREVAGGRKKCSVEGGKRMGDAVGDVKVSRRD